MKLVFAGELSDVLCCQLTIFDVPRDISAALHPSIATATRALLSTLLQRIHSYARAQHIAMLNSCLHAQVVDDILDVSCTTEQLVRYPFYFNA